MHSHALIGAHVTDLVVAAADSEEVSGDAPGHAPDGGAERLVLPSREREHAEAHKRKKKVVTRRHARSGESTPCHSVRTVPACKKTCALRVLIAVCTSVP